MFLYAWRFLSKKTRNSAALDAACKLGMAVSATVGAEATLEEVSCGLSGFHTASHLGVAAYTKMIASAMANRMIVGSWDLPLRAYTTVQVNSSTLAGELALRERLT